MAVSDVSLCLKISGSLVFCEVLFVSQTEYRQMVRHVTVEYTGVNMSIGMSRIYVIYKGCR